MTILAYVFLGILALLLLSGVGAALLLSHGSRLDEQHDTDGSKRFDRHADEALNVGRTAAGSVPYVPSNHPKDCAEKCCWEIRLTEMHDAFDWSAYEYEMRGIR